MGMEDSERRTKKGELYETEKVRDGNGDRYRELDAEKCRVRRR